MEKLVGVETVVLLEKNIQEICTVAEWAEKADFTDPKDFSRKFRNFFGHRPKEFIKLKKIEKFQDLIRTVPRPSTYEIAWELGMKDVEQLNKYIKYHTGKRPTEWKNSVVKFGSESC